MPQTKFEIIHAATSSRQKMLLESAPLAERLSRDLCHINPATGNTCAWNHGVWQYLRLLDIITTPDLHAEFFRQSFLTLHSEKLRILISGTADYGMLEKVHEGFIGCPTPPDITVLDRCPTPLELCKWYAARESMHITCRCIDILEYNEHGLFDVICTDSFLAQFKNEDRELLAKKWNQLLRPGGKVITVNRIRPNVSGTVNFSPEQIARFTETVNLRLTTFSGSPIMDSARISMLAKKYAEHQTTHALSSLDEIRGLFKKTGFTIVHLSCELALPLNTNGLAGPTVPDNSEYACLVAVRD